MMNSPVGDGKGKNKQKANNFPEISKSQFDALLKEACLAKSYSEFQGYITERGKRKYCDGFGFYTQNKRLIDVDAVKGKTLKSPISKSFDDTQAYLLIACYQEPNAFYFTGNPPSAKLLLETRDRTMVRHIVECIVNESKKHNRKRSHSWCKAIIDEATLIAKRFQVKVSS